MIEFIKMHGIGNDYIYLDCIANPMPDDIEQFARHASDRHTGIGGDGVVLILPSEVADCQMRMFNADGSEGRMCGNAIRCVGKYYYETYINKTQNNSSFLTPHSSLIFVDNVLDTLQQLARYHREQLDIPFVGITGTNGKTTTKELVATVLSKKYRVHYTQGNFNNHIGVPLTLLSIKPDCEIAVIEMGANHPGEIKTLANIALPTCGLITNVGKAHLEGFGSLEGVINTKKELYDNLVERGGHVFVNAANPLLMNMLNK